MSGEFIVKDSGKRKKFNTGMQRDINEDKPAFYLITPKLVPYSEQMLTRWAAHMRRGANKYADRNWELAATQEELERFKDSAFRHFMQWLLDEDDEDHAAAVFFNIQGAEYVKWRLKNDKQNGK